MKYAVLLVLVLCASAAENNSSLQFLKTDSFLAEKQIPDSFSSAFATFQQVLQAILSQQQAIIASSGLSACFDFAEEQLDFYRNPNLCQYVDEAGQQALMEILGQLSNSAVQCALVPINITQQIVQAWFAFASQGFQFPQLLEMSSSSTQDFGALLAGIQQQLQASIENFCSFTGLEE